MDIFPLVQSLGKQIVATVDVVEIESALSLLAESKLTQFLNNDHWALEQKITVLKGAGLSDPAIKVILLSAKLIQHYMLDSKLWAEYVLGYVYELRGEPFVRVVLAKPISKDAQAEIEKNILQQLFPKVKKAHFLYSYDEQLLGGAVIKHNDQVWDSSLLGKFSQLKAQFTTV